jgi:rare lipoprotein A
MKRDDRLKRREAYGDFLVPLRWLLSGGLVLTGLIACANLSQEEPQPQVAAEVLPAPVASAADAGERNPPPAASPPVAVSPLAENGIDLVPAQTLETPPAPEVAKVDEVIEQGRASWYGRRFQGRRTASGELFDMHALTAAHKTLPFGTLVRVRSLSNGREVVVRINDRGPYTKGRVIDLSQAAMAALKLRARGVIRVELLRE